MTAIVLDIKSEVQKKGTLCWAACIQMILNESLILRNQWEILKNYNILNPPNDNRLLTEINTESCSIIEERVFPRMGTSLLLYQEIFDSYNLNTEKKTGGFITEEDIRQILNQSQCILISKSHVPPIRFHALVIVGYCDGNNFQIAVNDPFIYYAIPSFNACIEINKAGKCIFNFKNFKHYNYQIEKGKHFGNIQVISNFKNKVKGQKRRLIATLDNDSSAITFPTISDSLRSFSNDFVFTTFGYNITLAINPFVKIFSYEKNEILNATDENGLMSMPLFNSENAPSNSYLEFVFIKVSDATYVPICIREPYFYGYKDVSGTMIPDDSDTDFSFDHIKPNYWLTLIPNTGYKFMGFNFNGASFFTPLYNYNELGINPQKAISKMQFFDLYNKFNI